MKMKAMKMRFVKSIAGGVVCLGLLSAGFAASKISSMKEVTAPPFSGGVGSAIGQDRTGSPISSGNCANCHSGGTFNSNLSVEVKDAGNNVVTSYTPGSTYTIEYSLTGTAIGNGFQSTILTSANAQAGSYGTINTSNSQISTVSGVDYFEHQGAQVGAIGFFSVDWTAPSAGTGDVTIYGMGVKVNLNSGTSGDDPTSPLSFVLSEMPATDIDFPGNPYCDNVSNPTPVITGEQGGTFSAPAGLDINTSSGEINMAGSTAGTYTVTYTGATTSATFDVTINESFSTTDFVSICPNDTYQFGTQTLTAANAGLNTEVFQASNGCDSTVELTLAITQPFTVQIMDTICASETTTFEGQTLDSSNVGLNEVTLQSAVTGCDSIRQLFLFVEPESMTSISETICPSGTYDFNGQILDSSDVGLNTITITGSNGCDSTVELMLNVTPIDLTLTASTGTLEANQDNATYQWVDCYQNNAPIQGETGQSFNAFINGVYAVEITINGCTELSECTEVLVFGLDETTQARIDLYPIPADEVLFVQHLDDLTEVNAMEIVNLSGQTLWKKAAASNEINVSELPSGSYFLKVQHAQGTEVVKFVKR